MAYSIANVYCGNMPVFGFDHVLLKNEIGRVENYFYENTGCHMTLSRVNKNSFSFISNGALAVGSDIEDIKYLYRITYSRKQGGKASDISRFYNSTMVRYNSSVSEVVIGKLYEEIQQVLSNEEEEVNEDGYYSLSEIMSECYNNSNLVISKGRMTIDENTLELITNENLIEFEICYIKVNENNFENEDCYKFFKNQVGNDDQKYMNVFIRLDKETNLYKISTLIKYLPNRLLEKELQSMGKDLSSIKYCSKITKYNREEQFLAVAYVDGLTENELYDLNNNLVRIVKDVNLNFIVLTGDNKKLLLDLDEYVCSSKLDSLLELDDFYGITHKLSKTEFTGNGIVTIYYINLESNEKFENMMDVSHDSRFQRIQKDVAKVAIMLNAIYENNDINDIIEFQINVNGEKFMVYNTAKIS